MCSHFLVDCSSSRLLLDVDSRRLLAERYSCWSNSSTEEERGSYVDVLFYAYVPPAVFFQLYLIGSPSLPADCFFPSFSLIQRIHALDYFSSSVLAKILS